MDIECPQCGSNAVELLRRRPDGCTECLCVSCGTATVLPDPIRSEEDTAAALRERNIAPYQPKDWENEAAKMPSFALSVWLKGTLRTVNPARAPIPLTY
jgi:hypothetical protein